MKRMTENGLSTNYSPLGSLIKMLTDEQQQLHLNDFETVANVINGLLTTVCRGLDHRSVLDDVDAIAEVVEYLVFTVCDTLRSETSDASCDFLDIRTDGRLMNSNTASRWSIQTDPNTSVASPATLSRPFNSSMSTPCGGKSAHFPASHLSDYDHATNSLQLMHGSSSLMGNHKNSDSDDVVEILSKKANKQKGSNEAMPNLQVAGESSTCLHDNKMENKDQVSQSILSSVVNKFVDLLSFELSKCRSKWPEARLMDTVDEIYRLEPITKKLVRRGELRKPRSFTVPPSQVVYLLVEYKPDQPLSALVQKICPPTPNNMPKHCNEFDKYNCPNFTRLLHDIGYLTVYYRMWYKKLLKDSDSKLDNSIEVLDEVPPMRALSDPSSLFFMGPLLASPKSYTCAVCRFSSETLIGLDIHKQTQHKRGSVFICAMCDSPRFRCNREIELEKHSLIEHGVAPESNLNKLTCPHCLRTFTIHRSLKKHLLQSCPGDSINDPEDAINSRMWPPSLPHIPFYGDFGRKIAPNTRIKPNNDTLTVDEVASLNNYVQKCNLKVRDSVNSIVDQVSSGLGGLRDRKAFKDYKDYLIRPASDRPKRTKATTSSNSATVHQSVQDVIQRLKASGPALTLPHLVSSANATFASYPSTRISLINPNAAAPLPPGAFPTIPTAVMQPNSYPPMFYQPGAAIQARQMFNDPSSTMPPFSRAPLPFGMPRTDPLANATFFVAPPTRTGPPFLNLLTPPPLTMAPRVSRLPQQRAEFRTPSFSKPATPSNSTETIDIDPPPVRRAANSISNMFTCEICDVCFTLKQSCIIHLKTNHKLLNNDRYSDLINSVPFLSCSTCKKRFFTYEGLERHLLMAHGFVSPTLLQMARSQKDGAKCKLCTKVFAYNILRHLVVDHKIKLSTADVVYSCDSCGEKFKFYASLEHHIKQKHRGCANPKSVVNDADETIKMKSVKTTPGASCSAKPSLSPKQLQGMPKLVPESISSIPLADSLNANEFDRSGDQSPNAKRISFPTYSSNLSKSSPKASCAKVLQRQASTYRKIAPKTSTDAQRLEDNSADRKKFRSDAESEASSVDSKRPKKFSCTPCNIAFGDYSEVLDHWSKVHLKKVTVETCLVDKCRVCIKNFKRYCDLLPDPIVPRKKPRSSDNFEIICLD